MTITEKEAKAIMNGMAFLMTTSIYKVTGKVPDCEEINEFVREHFLEYCDCEGITDVVED